MDLLDLLDDLLEAEKPAPDAPLHFTSGFYTPDEFQAALEARLKRGVEAWHRHHMWHMAPAMGWCGGIGEHALCVMSADLRCYGHREKGSWERIPCSCVGELMYQAICDTCRWREFGTEKHVVEAWHDHAMPGWRDLPLFPAELRGPMGSSKMTPAREAWFDEHYPEAFRVQGAPILTARDRIGSRNVPRYSPFGGFDIGIITAQEAS